MIPERTLEPVIFRDRRDAGLRLGRALRSERIVGASDHPLVLGLPRGGIPVAAEVARVLGAPLDVLIARKLGAPGNPELGVGAIAEGGGIWLNQEIVGELGVTRRELDEAIARESRELARRAHLYRRDRPLPALTGRKVILVDDGLATGATAMAAVRRLKNDRARVLVAVPVASREGSELLASEADDVFCLERPAGFYAVGSWYEDFAQISDHEVIASLEQTRDGAAA